MKRFFRQPAASRIDNVSHPWVGKAPPLLLRNHHSCDLAVRCSRNDLLGLQLPKSIEGIVVRTEVLRHCPVASNGLIEHPADCDTVDHSGLHAEPNDPGSPQFLREFPLCARASGSLSAVKEEKGRLQLKRPFLVGFHGRKPHLARGACSSSVKKISECRFAPPPQG